MTQSSAQRKFTRGVEQVKKLRAEARFYRYDDAYVFRVDKEPSSPQKIRYRCYATERKAPPEHWPLLTGEAIQNLRSSLDHAVWSVWKAAGNSGTGDHTKFPIATDPDGFKSQAGFVLQGVPKPIRTLIEGAQPYRIAPQAPARDPLELLRTLSNIDKHRSLTTVAVAVEYEWISHAGGIDFSHEKFATDRPLGHGETEISVFTVTAEREIMQMDVNPEFTYQVRIEGMPLDIRGNIVRRVFETVGEIETGQPKSPFVTYPL